MFLLGRNVNGVTNQNWEWSGWGVENSKKSLCQFCVNLIGTSWHLVTQRATSVTVSIFKLRVNKLRPCFGSRGSEVQILSPRPFKTRGYGLSRSPFLLWLALGLAFASALTFSSPHFAYTHWVA